MALFKRAESNTDPLWDRFLNAAPVDPNNLVATGVRKLPDGTVYAVKTEVHSPEVMSRHIGELALFLGADRCGIARLTESEGDYPFAVVCVVLSNDDPRIAPGIGGQTPVLKAAYAVFNVAAWIRECGYRASRTSDLDGETLAVQAGIGSLDASGRLVVEGSNRFAHVGQVILTDLPLAPSV
jgi:hypothetical protein